MNQPLNPPDSSDSLKQINRINPIVELKANHDAMLKEIRSWGYWTLGLGALHMISSGFLDSAWGILLVIVGLASFLFRSAPMFIVYAVVLAWAALSNLASLNPQWMIFALLQIYLAFRTFTGYRRFASNEEKFLQWPGSDQTARRRTKKSFPWIGALLGVLSVFGCIATVALAFVLIGELGVNTEPPTYYLFMIRLVEIVAVMGFSVSLASLFARHTPKALPILGVIASGVMMLVFVGLNIIFAFA
jgi:hypothetical protein